MQRKLHPNEADVGNMRRRSQSDPFIDVTVTKRNVPPSVHRVCCNGNDSTAEQMFGVCHVLAENCYGGLRMVLALLGSAGGLPRRHPGMIHLYKSNHPHNVDRGLQGTRFRNPHILTAPEESDLRFPFFARHGSFHTRHKKAQYQGSFCCM
jgi:hypothetical protein